MALKSTTKRWLSGSLILLSVLWLCFVGYIDWAMRQPPEVFGRVMARMPMPAYFLFPFETMWTDARKGTLKPGDTAPDLNVQMLEGKQPLALSGLWANRPVVLVFGSYT
jgi:Iodothyronine deiodinase